MPLSNSLTARLPRVPFPERAGRFGAPLGIGVAVIYMSLIVLIPFAALINGAFDNGWDGFWNAITNERALTALKLTVGVSLVVVAINAVMGTIIAWVLVRDRFFGRTVVNSLIDLPFALPTIVAGVVLLAMYGPDSPVGVNIAFTRTGVCVALLLVTLPFVVRSVQPVLLELDREMEEAAASLGATPPDHLPAHHPAQPDPRHARRHRASPSPGRSGSSAPWCSSPAPSTPRSRRSTSSS